MNIPAEKISTVHAKSDKLFYVIVTLVPYRISDEKVLLLKRSDTEKVHPGKWGIPGGKLEWSDIDLDNPDEMNGIVKDYHHTLFELAARETQEESGIDIENDMKFVTSKVFIRPDGVPTVLFQFTAPVTENGKEVILEQGAFTDFAWVSEKDIESFDCIQGIKEEVTQARSLYS